ncbi:MAG: hypothetical protein H0V26_12125 [Solirubrobacterales bacterium]|nr:hypothetical protein [Solirubrobacterales bacterium]
MDLHLKRLAEVSIAVTEAEEAIADGAFQLASERLDTAREGLAELRAGWLGMGPAERRVVGSAAGPVRARLDTAAAGVPRLQVVSEMSAPVVDPEQEADPEAA